jgi:DNA-directed RNA polymerase subunit H (RpoH/RPB5)
VSSTENMIVDITMFQDQALEVLKELGAAQQILLTKVETVQDHFRVIDQALNSICLREREAISTWTTFQEAFVSSTKEGEAVTSRLFVSEQIRGDIILKSWESNITESRKMAKEEKEFCEEAFHSLKRESLGLDKEDSSGVLGHINITKHQLDIKTNMEEAQVEISQIKQGDIIQINRWLVNPNLQLQSTVLEDRLMGERLPQLENKLYIFEVNNLTEPSRLVAQFVSRCIKCIEKGKGSTIGNK